MMDTLHLKKIIFLQDSRLILIILINYYQCKCTLQEHEESLSRDGLSHSVSEVSEAASETAETEELNENLLDDDEEDDAENEERSWKRRSNGEETA